MQATTLNKEKVTYGVKFLVLAGIAAFFPFFAVQGLVGTIINAMFFISVAVLGIRGAVVLALVPSLVSISTGLLPVDPVPRF